MPDKAGGSDVRVTAAERRAQVLELRRQRLQFDEIGRQLGVSKQRAFQLYQAAIADIPRQQRDQHLAEELLLADDAIADLLAKARNPKQPRTAVEAWNSIRGWAERKARLLGLDAPAKVEVSDARRAEIERLAAALGLGDVDAAGAGAAPGDAPAGEGGPHTA